MHHQPRNEPDFAAAVQVGVDKLVAKGVSPRDALRRTARKYGMDRKHVSALMAQGRGPAGGVL
jgi:hypothetical protein